MLVERRAHHARGGLSLLRVVASTGVLFFTRRPRRQRPAPRTCRHQWRRQVNAGGGALWTCGRCGRRRADCPHLSWEFVHVTRHWQCLGCGVVRTAAAWQAHLQARDGEGMPVLGRAGRAAASEARAVGDRG